MKSALTNIYSAISVIAITGFLLACGGGGSSDNEPDTTPPVITILGNNPIEVSYLADYVDPGATANDNLDGNVSVITSGEVLDCNSLHAQVISEKKKTTNWRIV